MSEEMVRNAKGLPVLVTKALESVGILNKGSASLATGDLNPTDAATKMPIVETSLNVTRVGGTAAAIAAAGAAALALFNVDKAKDPTPVVMAAYLSSGFIVAAALVTAAIIISADIRTRAVADLKEASSVVPSTGTKPADSKAFKVGWESAVGRLDTVREHIAAGPVDNYVPLWLDAEASVAFTKDLRPPDDLVDESARMLAAQRRICGLLDGLLLDRSKEAAVKPVLIRLITEAQSTLRSVP